MIHPELRSELSEEDFYSGEYRHNMSIVGNKELDARELSNMVKVFTGSSSLPLKLDNCQRFFDSFWLAGT